MILLDAGNSSIKAQFWCADQLQGSLSCSYRLPWITSLGRWLQALPADHCYLVSVLDAERQAGLDLCLRERFGDAVTRYGSESHCLGVQNGYLEPERLGADRWLALVAAAEITAADCMVIDAGSAITVDLLRADGQHLGGAILPGFNTSIEDFKRIFSHIDFNHPEIARSSSPGCSTEAAIQIDYAHTSIDWLPGLVNRWIQKLDRNATILLTGGDAARVQRMLERPARIVPDLVFRGIRRLAHR